jgi:DNA-binding NarL/FixJ family response regulator
MRVLLVSKGGLFADAFRHWLRALIPDAHVCRASASEVARHRGETLPRLVFVDSDELPKRSLRSEMKRIRAQLPSTCLIAIGSTAGPAFVRSLIDLGIDAYLPKSRDERSALAVISNALLMHASLASSGKMPRAGKAATPPAPPRNGNPYGLTPRELDVLELACFGLSNPQIAQHHRISTGVVKLHLHSAYAKLRVQGRVQAIRIVEHMDAIRSLHLKHVDSASALLAFLLPHMTHERHARGHVLFRKGDPGNVMYYVQQGRVRLPELDVNMAHGDVFGELGVFAPTHVRTSGARCETATDLFKLTAEQTQRLCFENPRFAYYMIRLIADRLVGERATAKTAKQ